MPSFRIVPSVRAEPKKRVQTKARSQVRDQPQDQMQNSAQTRSCSQRPIHPPSNNQENRMSNPTIEMQQQLGINGRLVNGAVEQELPSLDSISSHSHSPTLSPVQRRHIKSGQMRNEQAILRQSVDDEVAQVIFLLY